MSDFHDITDPGEFLPEPSTPWWIWLLVTLGSLLMLVIGWYIFKQSRYSKQKTTLLDQARSRLQTLRDDSPALPPHETASRISLILRRYLEAAFSDPALFETNEEFTLRESALNQLHPDSREPVTQFLNTLAQLKYSPHHSTDVSAIIDDAEAIIANIELNVGDSDD